MRPTGCARCARQHAQAAVRRCSQATSQELMLHVLPPQCLKYSTDQQADLKKVEALNNTFFRLMARGADAPGE